MKKMKWVVLMLAVLMVAGGSMLQAETEAERCSSLLSGGGPTACTSGGCDYQHVKGPDGTITGSVCVPRSMNRVEFAADIAAPEMAAAVEAPAVMDVEPMDAVVAAAGGCAGKENGAQCTCPDGLPSTCTEQKCNC